MTGAPPNTLKSLTAQAIAASTGKDWPLAATAWGELLVSGVVNSRALHSYAVACRELGRFDEALAVLDKECSLVATNAQLLLCKADFLMRLRQFPQAREVIERARAVDGGNRSVLWTLSACHRQMGCFDEALVVLRQASLLFPDDQKFIAARAETATTLKLYDEAIECRSQLCSLDTDTIKRHFDCAEVHRLAGNTTEAISILRGAVARFEGSLEAVSRLGNALEKEGDLGAAAAHYLGSIRLHGVTEPLEQAYLRTLRDARDWASADQYLDQQLGARPDCLALIMEKAQLASSRLDWSAAMRCWERAHQIDPTSVSAVVGLSDLLRRFGRQPEAAALLGAAAEDHPSNVRILFAQAQLAGDCADWEGAVRQWQQLLALNPDNTVIQQGLSHARFSLRSITGDASAGALIDADHAANSEPHKDAAAVLSRFESLGSNCEFGLLQRAAGIEPLGLLRFAGITPAELIAALGNRLEGVGDPEHTVLCAEDAEYYTRDTRYGMRVHTFITPGAAPEEKILEINVKKIVFLKRKLIEDLQDAEKIFVFRVFGPLPEAQQLAMLSALRTYGPNKLLLVFEQYAMPQIRVGCVHLHSPNLAIGVRPNLIPGLSVTDKIPHETWLDICRGAIELLDGTRH